MGAAAWDMLPPSLATFSAPNLTLPPLVRFGLIIAAIVFAIFGVAIALMNARPKAAPVPKPMSLRVTAGAESPRVAPVRPPSPTRVEREQPATVNANADETGLDPYQLAQARASLRDVRATLDPHPPAQPPYVHPDDADNPFIERPNGLTAPSTSARSMNGTAAASVAAAPDSDDDEDYESPTDADNEAFSISQQPARGSMLSGFFTMAIDALKSWSAKRAQPPVEPSYDDEIEEPDDDEDDDHVRVAAPIAEVMTTAPTAPLNGLRAPSKIGQAEVVSAPPASMFTAPDAKTPKTAEELALEEAAWELALARSSTLERQAISVEIEDDTSGAVLPDYLLAHTMPDGVAVAIGLPETPIAQPHDTNDLSYVMDTVADRSTEFVDVLFEDDAASTERPQTVQTHAHVDPSAIAEVETSRSVMDRFDLQHRKPDRNDGAPFIWEHDSSEPAIAINLEPEVTSATIESAPLADTTAAAPPPAPTSIPTAAFTPIVEHPDAHEELVNAGADSNVAPKDELDIAALLAQVESDSKSGRIDEEHARRERERIEAEERERKAEMLRSVTWTRSYLGADSPSLDIYERIRFIKVLGDMDDFDAVMPVLYQACNEEPHPDVLFEAYRVLTDCYNGDFLMAAHQLYLEHDDERMRDVASRGIADLKRVPS
jgi:hypothetical protein